MLRGLAGTALVAGIALAGVAAPAAAEEPAPTGSAAGTDGLEPMLATAYTLAERQAHQEGVPLWIASGHRSPAEQERLWEEGIATYGSPGAARQWVLPPDESTHVTGRAIDVGPEQGAQWLQDNGNRWGLCRTFDNEYWHFEVQTVPGGVCPPRWPDASVRPKV
ncbi:M15 family metallopeptidase [Nocardia spumae]|uniref:M15 family metallopeptidase n=1 Tax=Nocardia spumae TaxID=2887190 RepID=UPI001D15312F|nr:M15 family metallopeptidase [Nocardia spumae]